MTDRPSETPSIAAAKADPSRSVRSMALIGFSLAAFMLLVPLPLNGRLGSAIGDLAHAPMFGGITLATLLLWQHFRPLLRFGRDWIGRLALVALCVFAIGILVEIVQSITGRNAAMHDVVANGLGIAAMTLICFGVLTFRQSRQRRWQGVLAITLAIGCVIGAIFRPVQIALDVFAVQRQFPMLASFETATELTRWYFDDCRGELTRDNATDGQRAMRLFLEKSDHPAATLIETAADWSDVESLQLDVTLARDYAQPLEVLVKVIDQQHQDYHSDTCRKSFKIAPGLTTRLTINRDEMIHGPDARKLLLAKVKFVSILVYQPQKETHIDVDYLHVTKRVTRRTIIQESN